MCSGISVSFQDLLLFHWESSFQHDQYTQGQMSCGQKALSSCTFQPTKVLQGPRVTTMSVTKHTLNLIVLNFDFGDPFSSIIRRKENTTKLHNYHTSGLLQVWPPAISIHINWKLATLRPHPNLLTLHLHMTLMRGQIYYR